MCHEKGIVGGFFENNNHMAGTPEACCVIKRYKNNFKYYEVSNLAKSVMPELD